MRRQRLLFIEAVLCLSGRLSGQLAMPGDIRPGKLIHDKHDPRNGFIVVDTRTRLAYIQAATLWRPMDDVDVDLVQGPSRDVNKAGLPRTLPNDTVVVCDFKAKEPGGTTPKFNCDHLAVYHSIDDAARTVNAIPHALNA